MASSRKRSKIDLLAEPYNYLVVDSLGDHPRRNIKPHGLWLYFPSRSSRDRFKRAVKKAMIERGKYETDHLDDPDDVI